MARLLIRVFFIHVRCVRAIGDVVVVSVTVAASEEARQPKPSSSSSCYFSEIAMAVVIVRTGHIAIAAVIVSISRGPSVRIIAIG
jgi:hypothetical protein